MLRATAEVPAAVHDGLSFVTTKSVVGGLPQSDHLVIDVRVLAISLYSASDVAT